MLHYHFLSYWHNTHCHDTVVPPSPPRNVRVVNSTDNAITLTWEIPEFDGGRGGLVYGLYYQADDRVRIKFGTVNRTIGVITGICIVCHVAVILMIFYYRFTPRTVIYSICEF